MEPYPAESRQEEGVRACVVAATTIPIRCTYQEDSFGQYAKQRSLGTQLHGLLYCSVDRVQLTWQSEMSSAKGQRTCEVMTDAVGTVGGSGAGVDAGEGMAGDCM